MRAFALSTLLWAALSGPANGEALPSRIESGRDLDAVCHNDRVEPVVRCIAYVDAVRRGTLVPSAVGPQTYCVPGDVSKGKLSRMVKAVVRAQPDRFDEKAEVLVAEAIKKSYPCGSAAARP